jgi:hypothetical protein
MRESAEIIVRAGPGTLRDSTHAFAMRTVRELPADANWSIVITRWEPERSSPQNRYLFGVAYPALVAALGFTVDDWHEFCCGEHFGWVDRARIDGKGRQVPVRTTTRNAEGKRSVLGTREFAAFVEHVQAIGAMRGVVIPDPS